MPGKTERNRRLSSGPDINGIRIRIKREKAEVAKMTDVPIHILKSNRSESKPGVQVFCDTPEVVTIWFARVGSDPEVICPLCLEVYNREF